MTVLESKSADHPGRVGREMYRPGQPGQWCKWGHHRRHRLLRRRQRHRWRRRHWQRRQWRWSIRQQHVVLQRGVTLDDDVFPPSSCCITFVFATIVDLLLDQTASVTVITYIRGGTGGEGVELAGGRHSQLEPERQRRRPP
jgi:hypothetical protein